MSRKPAILCGIVCYSTPPMVLRSTVDSLLKSTLPLDVHVYCNSSDPIYTQALQDALLGCDARVSLAIGMPNEGFGQGHNAIVERAGPGCGWYVCCNPDIVVFPDTIEKLCRFGDAHPESVILSPKILSIDGTVQPLSRQNPTFPRWVTRQVWRILPGLLKPFEIRFNYEASAPIEFASGCFFIIRTEQFRKIGGFSPSFFLYYEDADISRKAGSIGRIFFVADAQVIHYWDKAWSKSWRALLIQLKSLMIYFNRWGWF